jgi:hypothetical protein
MCAACAAAPTTTHGLRQEVYKDEAANRGGPVAVDRDASAYSWLPGTGLNLIPRNTTPAGFGLAASMVIAVQMMLIEVAAMAVVP